jgi:hypothetical protein
VAVQDSESDTIRDFVEIKPKKPERKKYNHVAFSEKDYAMRKPIEEY